MSEHVQAARKDSFFQTLKFKATFREKHLAENPLTTRYKLEPK